MIQRKQLPKKRYLKATKEWVVFDNQPQKGDLLSSFSSKNQAALQIKKDVCHPFVFPEETKGIKKTFQNHKTPLFALHLLCLLMNLISFSLNQTTTTVLSTLVMILVMAACQLKGLYRTSEYKQYLAKSSAQTEQQKQIAEIAAKRHELCGKQNQYHIVFIEETKTQTYANLATIMLTGKDTTYYIVKESFPINKNDTVENQTNIIACAWEKADQLDKQILLKNKQLEEADKEDTSAGELLKYINSNFLEESAK